MDENKPIIPDEIISPDCNVDRIHKNIKIETLIEYKSKGLSYGEIATLTGCSRQNIQQRLAAAEYNKEDLENFKKHRGDVFAHFQSLLINSLTPEVIKGMNPYQRIIGLSVLFDKERLQRGQSTENISIAEIQGSIDDLQAQAAKLRESL